MKTYLSLGAGIDTTAIILMPDVMEKIDFVMFADTGSENPETYEYMEKYIKPHLASINKQLVIARGEETVKGQTTTNMEQAYLGWKMIPVRFMRHCTDKWKIRPMHNYLKANYPDEFLRLVIWSWRLEKGSVISRPPKWQYSLTLFHTMHAPEHSSSGGAKS